MPTATMTSKGQLTIPIEVRKELGLKPGVRIDFYKVDVGEYMFRPRTGSIMDLKGCVAYSGPPVSIEEMDQAILDGVAENYLAGLNDSDESEQEDKRA